MLARHILRRQGGRTLRASLPSRLLHTSRGARQSVIEDASHNQAAMEQLIADELHPSAARDQQNALTDDDDGYEDAISQKDHAYIALHRLEREDAARVAAWNSSKHIRQTTGRLGSHRSPWYRPIDLIRNPAAAHEITLEHLLASQAHLGHATSLWHPANSRYIFGIRAGLHIIDLSLTLAHLRRACTVVQSVAQHGGIILFVGSRRRQDRIVVSAAQRAGGYHVFDRWKPGTITNRVALLEACQLKVVDEFDREVPGFVEQLKDRGPLKPELVVCLNPPENQVLLRECALNRIPTVGILDTDSNPSWLTYPIPANDDSLRSVAVIAGALSRAGEAGQKSRLALAQQGKILYSAGRALGLQLPDDASDRVAREGQAQDQPAPAGAGAGAGADAAARPRDDRPVEPIHVSHVPDVSPDAMLDSLLAQEELAGGAAEAERDDSLTEEDELLGLDEADRRQAALDEQSPRPKRMSKDEDDTSGR